MPIYTKKEILENLDEEWSQVPAALLERMGQCDCNEHQNPVQCIIEHGNPIFKIDTIFGLCSHLSQDNGILLKKLIMVMTDLKNAKSKNDLERMKKKYKINEMPDMSSFHQHLNQLYKEEEELDEPILGQTPT